MKLLVLHEPQQQTGRGLLGFGPTKSGAIKKKKTHKMLPSKNTSWAEGGLRENGEINNLFILFS